MLDIGRASGVGVGSEFTAANAEKGQPVILRVTESGRDRAFFGKRSQSGRGQGCARHGFRTFQVGSGRAGGAACVDVAGEFYRAGNSWPRRRQLRRRASRLVSDPAEEPWTHVLGWDGMNWTLQQAGAASPTVLGGQLTADALKKNLPAGAKLWANLPPPKELAVKLSPGGAASAVQPAKDLAAADYALTGTLTPDGPAYAWYHKNELAAGPPSGAQASGAKDHSPGCSATSQYPVRSNWVDMTGLADLDKGSAALIKYASLLAKVHGWLDLANSPTDASSGDYYTLTMVPAAGGTHGRSDSRRARATN